MALLISPDVTLSYPHLFTPRLPPNPKPGQKPRYQCVCLFPIEMTDSDKTLLTAMKQAALDAAVAKWGAKAPQLIGDQQIRWPFIKKFTDASGAPKYDPEKWQAYISPWSEEEPGIVSRYAGPDGKPAKLTDSKLIYAGCVVKVSLRPFVYEAQGNRGISFGLQAVQLRGDGPRLDNRVAAEDTFSAEDRPQADLSTIAGTVAPTPGAGGAVGSKIADLFS